VCGSVEGPVGGGKEQEVVEEERRQLLPRLALTHHARVQQLPWTQAVGHRVERYLL